MSSDLDRPVETAAPVEPLAPDPPPAPPAEVAEVPAAPVRAWVGPAVQPARTAVAVPSLRRSVATLLLFVVGIAAGIGAFAVANRPPALPSYPPLAGAPEPPAAHELAAAIATNDVGAIADHLPPASASDLSTALQPIVEVTDVTYLGTVEHDGRQLAGYIIHGRDDSSQKQIVGLVLDVSGGVVVAVNQ